MRVEATVGGALIAVQRRDIDQDDAQDANFFDADYSIAASTGNLMWEGSWAAVELLRDPSSWLAELLVGKRVVELGAGIGLLGLDAHFPLAFVSEALMQERPRRVNIFLLVRFDHWH